MEPPMSDPLYPIHDSIHPESSRKWFVMAAVASGMFLSTIDGSIVNVTLPILERDLHTDFAIVQWVMLAYMLTISTLMLSVGRLADMIGKKPLYLSGFIIFTIGSAFCGLAPNITVLILARIFQAIGAVMMTALGTAIITEAFPPAERGKALGIGSSMVSIGLISGPTLGGLILGFFTWHWIFFVNLPIGIVGSILVWRFVPAHKPAGKESFDFAGSICMFVGLLTFLVGLTFGQMQGFLSPLTLALLITSVISIWVFVSIERRAVHPMIELNIFQNRLFSVNLISGFITFVATGGTILLMPFFLQNVLGYQPDQAGLLLAVFPLGMGIIAPLAGWLSDRLGTRRLTVAGLALLLLGYIAITGFNQQTSAFGYIIGFLPIGLGMGIFQSPNNSAVMGSVARHRLGIASGLLSLTRIVGQTAGMAILGSIWASRAESLSGLYLGGDVTSAPIPIQVGALQQTLWTPVIIVLGALILSIWALRKETSQANSIAEKAI